MSDIRKEYITLLRLGLPILVGQVGGIATSFADNIMVGRFSTDALASASFCNNVFNLALLCCMGFAYGVTPLVGALYARRDETAIGAMMRNAAVLNTLFCLALCGVMTIVYFNVDRLGQSEELLPLIRPYFLLSLAGMLPLALFNVFAQWSYAINNTSLPMWILLGANVLNVAGNWVLIEGRYGMPQLGLTGAGISTLAARVAAAIVLISVFFMLRRYEGYKRGFLGSALTRPMMRRLWVTSLPVSLQMAFETGSFSIAAVMAGWLGKTELAAFQIIFTIGMLGFCIYYAIGAAVAVRVSNAKGAASVSGMRLASRAGYHIMILVMIGASLTFLFAGPAIMGMFSTDPAVVALAVSMIVPLVMYQLGDATQVNYANALRGTSNVTPMLWIALVSYIVVGIPATYLLCFTVGWGLYGIVLSFSLSLFLAAGLYLTAFRRTLRREA